MRCPSSKTFIKLSNTANVKNNLKNYISDTILETLSIKVIGIGCFASASVLVGFLCGIV